jgi:hypothetical protein
LNERKPSNGTWRKNEKEVEMSRRLPDAVVNGAEPFLIVGAIAGG